MNCADQDLMQTVRKVFYNGGLNCAETTMRVLIERGVVEDNDGLRRMMSGFGGGMQRGLVCGAVTASVAAIGLKTGRINPDEPRELSAQAVAAFLQAFEARYGALECRELSRDYTSKSAEMYQYCADIVAGAAEMAACILNELQNESESG